VTKTSKGEAYEIQI